MKAAAALEAKLHAGVAIGRVDLGMLNRIIIDDAVINDRAGKRMLSIQRLSVKVSLGDLLQGKITVSSAQIFGLKAGLYKLENSKETNFAFLLDAFKSDGGSDNPVNLKINSLIIRRSAAAYDNLGTEYRGGISPEHIGMKDISAHITVDRIGADSLNVNVKRLSFSEQSGLAVKKLSFRFVAGNGGAALSDFHLQLPRSQLHLDATASYRLVNIADSTPPATSEHSLLLGGSTVLENMKFNGKMKNTVLLPGEIYALLGKKEGAGDPVNVQADFKGTGGSININNVELSQNGNFRMKAAFEARKHKGVWDWNAALEELETDASGIADVMKSIGAEDKLPSFARQIGHVSLSGEAARDGGGLTLSGQIATGIGGMSLQLQENGGTVKAVAETDSVNLAMLTGNSDFGTFSGSAVFEGGLSDGKPAFGEVEANIKTMAFRSHEYRNITVSAGYNREKALSLAAGVADEYGSAELTLACSRLPDDALHAENLKIENLHIPLTSYRLAARGVQPAALNLSDRWGDSAFSFDIDGDFSCNGIDNAEGSLRVSNLSKISQEGDYTLSALDINVKTDGKKTKKITLKSDFANIRIDGGFRYATLFDSFRSALAASLPVLSGENAGIGPGNRLEMYATFNKSNFARQLLGIPLTFSEPAHLIVRLDDTKHTAAVNADAAAFRYDGKNYSDAYLILSSPGDMIKAKANAKSEDDDGNTLQLTLDAAASGNILSSSLAFDSRAKNRIEGSLNTRIDLAKTQEGKPEAEITVLPSDILVADTTWHIRPSRLVWHDDYFKVDSFTVAHDRQYININGLARKNTDDNITATMKDVNVAYLLDFIDFHTVEFEGNASGTVKAASLFTAPDFSAHFTVENFRFETGAMGTALLNMDYNTDEGNLNINAVAREDTERFTVIKGFVSPKHNEIDLRITPEGASVNFLQKYCDDFARIFNASAWGELNVTGPLKAVQLLGSARITADMAIDALQTVYHIDRQTVNFNRDDIEFPGDTLTDRNGHIGVLSGHLPHHNLGNVSYDISVAARNFLALDIADFGEDSFCGTVYATGNCRIKEIPGGTAISADIVPEKGSFITYNASSPERVNDSFIHWRDAGKPEEPADGGDTGNTSEDDRDITADLRLNLLVHCNDDTELRVLMDEKTGDCISLNGNGVIRAAFYNKGTFDMFGNYVVERGTYSMTIQDVIKRDFSFKQGGTVSFGGDALGAQLNLQADYTLNSVPLSDINIGKSFTNNNVRVDCLMNIKGTPANPQVDFSLDMPTIGNDAKQMIMSMFNDNEEMNQQVIYLIAVGRFLNQESNNSSSQAQRYSQTSLAMQSILSGTVSQQLNNVLESVIGSKQWDFGANISTGEEGFNDAEYEGLVSGRMLNSRLLFNGQFGYRDNQNATSSFIGDFDLRYLLVPTGSMAVRVYNQTNNKYFAKNTLNTQGVSLVIKKDFSNWRGFFRRKKNTGK